MLKINPFQEKIKFLNTEKMKKLLLIIIFLLLSFNSFSQFKKINAQKRGDVLADITSAEKLSNEQQDNIKEQLRTILGDKLSLNYKVDEQIIGGLIIKVGSKMIDTSLSNKINKLKIAMKGA